MKPRWWNGLGLALVGLLAACSGESEPPPVAAAPGQLAAFLAYDSGTDRRQHERFEEAVRACMQAEGFRYVPVPYVEQPRGGIFGPPLGLFGSIDRAAASEYKREFGYGVTAVINELRQARADVRAGIEDPNAAIYAGLSPRHQRTYREALEGGGGEHVGCLASSQAKVDPAPDVLRRLEVAYAQLQERVDADPRVVELYRRWASCLKTSGYDFAGEEDIRRYLKPRLDRIVGAKRARDAGGGSVTVIGDRAIQTASRARRGDEDEFVGIDKGAFAKLKAEELAIARADRECRARLQTEEDRIRAGYEVEFLRAHRQDLEHVGDGWAGRAAR